MTGVTVKVRENIKYGADVIKFMATGGVLSEGDDPALEQYSPEEMRAIVATAHGLGRKVAAHAHGALGIRNAVLAGVDSIEHGTYIDDECIRLMKEHGTYLVPTLYLLDWFPEHPAELGVDARRSGEGAGGDAGWPARTSARPCAPASRWRSAPTPPCIRTA